MDRKMKSKKNSVFWFSGPMTILFQDKKNDSWLIWLPFFGKTMTGITSAPHTPIFLA